MSTLRSNSVTKTVQNPSLKKDSLKTESVKKTTSVAEPWTINHHVRLQTAEGRKRARKKERIEGRKRNREERAEE